MWQDVSADSLSCLPLRCSCTFNTCAKACSAQETAERARLLRKCRSKQTYIQSCMLPLAVHSTASYGRHKLKPGTYMWTPACRFRGVSIRASVLARDGRCPFIAKIIAKGKYSYAGTWPTEAAAATAVDMVCICIGVSQACMSTLMLSAAC